MEKTIKALIPPSKEKAPCKVVFTDDTSAQYWPDAKFGSPLEVGVTAECETEVKTHGEYTNTYLKRWGAEVPKGGKGGFPQRQPMSPEERWSIAAQAMIKAACELFSGREDAPIDVLCAAVVAAATRFMAFHDQQVSQATSNRAVAPDPNPAPGAPHKPTSGQWTAFGYTAPSGGIGMDPSVLKATVAKYELPAPVVRALRGLILSAYGLHFSEHLGAEGMSYFGDFMLNAPKASIDKAIAAAKEQAEMNLKAVIPQTEEDSYA